VNSFIFKHPSRFFLVSLPTVRRFPVFSVRVTAVMAAIWHSLPMLFYKMDIGPQLCFGFAVNVTFDLSAEFYSLSGRARQSRSILQSSPSTLILRWDYKINDTLLIALLDYRTRTAPDWPSAFSTR